MFGPVVLLIRQQPERYIVFNEAVYDPEPGVMEHANDDWDCCKVDVAFAIERNYLWCHRHGRSGNCIADVKQHREQAGITEIP